MHRRGKVIRNEEFVKKSKFKARKIGEIILKLRKICSKVWKSEVDGLLKSIFDDEEVMHCTRQRNSLQSLDELFVDMKELNLFSSRFVKKTCDVQDSMFTYYTTEETKVMEEQISLFSNSEICTTPEEHWGCIDAVSSRLGR